jgi:hypothetical protein
MKLNFRYLPASWGLVGDAYLEAEAHYNLTGEKLERRLIAIRYRDEPDVQERKNLDVDYKYYLVDDYEYDTELNKLTYEDETERLLHQLDIDIRHDKISAYAAATIKAKANHPEGVDRDLALLDVELEYGKIDKNAHAKQAATAKNEPWVGFVNSGFDPEQGIDGVFFELDWNPQWVDFLRTNGFVGKTDEQIVEDWFAEVCKSYAQPAGAVLNMSSPYPIGYSEDL